MPAHEDARLLPRGAERSTEASSAAAAAAPATAPTAAQRRAALRIQRRVRAYLDGKRLQRRIAALRIQRAVRLFSERKRFDRTRAAATKVQQWYRKRRAAAAVRDAASPRAATPRAASRLRTGGLIFCWYAFSAALSLFNKHLLGRRRGAFPAPLLMTSVQFFWQWVMAALLLRGPMAHLAPPPLPRRAWTRGVLPVGLATGADVGFSNLSLIYISLSFYVLCKSSAPLFLLGFAFALGLEVPSWRLAAAVATIVAGVACAVAGEASFDGRGFTLVMLAAALSGLRWTLTQLLMRGPDAAATGLSHPLVLLHHVLPVMGAAAAAASVLLERPWHRLPGSPYCDTPAHALATAALLFLAAVLAFGMSMAEFALVHDTSAVTLAVTGTCKEAVIVALSALVDGDPFGPLNGLGLALVMTGVGVYNWARHSAAAQRKAAAAAAAGAGGGGGDGGARGGKESGGGSAAAAADGAAAPLSPRRVASARGSGGGYGRLADAEEGRVAAASGAAGGAHHRSARHSSAGSQPGGGAAGQARAADDEQSYSDILEALLQNKTR